MPSNAEPLIWVVVPAAGCGARMGLSDLPKQYMEVGGCALIDWSLAPFLRRQDCHRIVVVLATDDPYWVNSRSSREPRILIAQGGRERADSVRAGLAALKDLAREGDWVVVHDAARPCLDDEDLDRLITRLRGDPVGGLLATQLVDTLKRSDEQGAVQDTLPRDGLWRALTPQMFRYGVLQRAIAQAAEEGRLVTDESQAVELLGLRPRLVVGRADNLKVTTPADLSLAARILAGRGES